MTEQLGQSAVEQQRDMDSRLEVLDSLVSRMIVVTSRMRRISDRLYGATPEGDSTEVESASDGLVARFGRLNDTGLGCVSAMEDLTTRIEAAV